MSVQSTYPVVSLAVLKSAEQTNAHQKTLGQEVDALVAGLFNFSREEVRKRKRLLLDKLKRRAKGFIRERWSDLSETEQQVRMLAYSRFCQCINDAFWPSLEADTSALEVADQELSSDGRKPKGSWPARRCPDNKGRRLVA